LRCVRYNAGGCRCAVSASSHPERAFGTAAPQNDHSPAGAALLRCTFYKVGGTATAIIKASSVMIAVD